MPNIKPLRDYVFIEVDQPEEMTKFGLYLPEEARKEKEEGKVLAIGGGVKSVEKGQKVLFNGGYGVREIEENAKKYKLVKEEEIIAVVEDK